MAVAGPAFETFHVQHYTYGKFFKESFEYAESYSEAAVAFCIRSLEDGIDEKYWTDDKSCLINFCSRCFINYRCESSIKVYTCVTCVDNEEKCICKYVLREKDKEHMYDDHSFFMGDIIVKRVTGPQ